MINKAELIDKMIKHLEELQAKDLMGTMAEKMPEKYGKNPKAVVEKVEIEVEPTEGEELEGDEMEKESEDPSEETAEMSKGSDGKDEEMTDDELKQLFAKFM